MQQESTAGRARWRTALLTVGGVVALVTALDTALDAQAVTRPRTGAAPVVAVGPAARQPVAVGDGVGSSSMRAMATAAPTETCTATGGAE